MSVRLEPDVAATPRREAATTRAGVRREAEMNFERRRAPFSLRCGALLIDYAIPVGVLALATMLARVFGDTRRASGVVLTAGYIAFAAVVFLNCVLIAAFSGRTLGKWIAGLRIERRDGEPLSIGRSLLRHLVGYPVTLATLGLGFLLAAFNSRGRALHDWLAGTVVVRSRGPRSTLR
jgi:uncharacterized RDD family membrane protein YckC